MKISIKSVILLAATLSVSALVPLSAASQSNSAAAFPVKTVIASVEGGERIELGTSQGDVAWAMRFKSREELSPNVWVYSGYHGDLDLANQHDCGTLVITFAQNKVVNLQLMNKPAVVIIAANLKRGSSVQSIASAK